jgi:hypothetical protein
MTYYEDIERKLENLNSKSDIRITIDDINCKSIRFIVYDCEVTDKSLQEIYETLNYIDSKKGDLNTMTDIHYYHSIYGSRECFGLRFELSVGEDIRSDDELNQIAEDDMEEQRYQEYKERNLK